MLLEVEDICVHYGRVLAVRSVSLSVAEGEIVSIVGPNGAGKSSTLLAIAGALALTSGSVRLDAEPIDGSTPEAIARKGICLVPEGRHIFAGLTVEENLRLGTIIRRDREAVGRDMEQVLDQFPVLAARLKSLAGTLSGGEQQQLAIARAYLMRPRLMMLDEPSLGLAPMIVDHVYEVLTALRGEGMTLLIVEQSGTRALDVSDRVYVLRTGSVELSGLSRDLRDTPELEEAYFGFDGGERVAG